MRERAEGTSGFLIANKHQQESPVRSSTGNMEKKRRKSMSKKLANAVKSMEKDLKTLQAKLAKLNKELEKVSTPKAPAKAAPKKAAAKKKAAPKKAAPKKAAPKKATAKKAVAKKAAAGPTAFDQVLGIIKRSKAGVNNAALIKKTGFDAKKVANIIYKAKTKGLIKSPKKGVYTKA